MKYRVYLTTTASATLDVEVPDDLGEDEAREQAIEEAIQEAPSGVCASCSGYGQEWSLELGGDWDVVPADGVEQLD
jgi:hypothetical protein